MCSKPEVNKGRRLRAALYCAAAAFVAWPGLTVAQESSHVAGAGGGSFTSAATFNGVTLMGMRFGFGIDISPDGTAVGDYETTLLGLNSQGQPQVITIEGKATSGALDASGGSTFAGASIVDMGDGSAPRSGVPFTILIATNAAGHPAMTLTVDTTSLPTATVEKGGVTVKACSPPEVGTDLVFLDVSMLSWSPSGPASTYNLYRGVISNSSWAFNHSCLAPALASPGAPDGVAPSSGRAFYYLVSGKNSCGEGPLGAMSSGQPRPNTAPCL